MLSVYETTFYSNNEKFQRLVPNFKFQLKKYFIFLPDKRLKSLKGLVRLFRLIRFCTEHGWYFHNVRGKLTAWSDTSSSSQLSQSESSSSVAPPPVGEPLRPSIELVTLNRADLLLPVPLSVKVCDSCSNPRVGGSARIKCNKMKQLLLQQNWELIVCHGPFRSGFGHLLARGTKRVFLLEILFLCSVPNSSSSSDDPPAPLVSCVLCASSEISASPLHTPATQRRRSCKSLT